MSLKDKMSIKGNEGISFEIDIDTLIENKERWILKNFDIAPKTKVIFKDGKEIVLTNKNIREILNIED